MNGLVPVLVAVLLAEFGPRAALYADARMRSVAPWIIIASIVAASAGGALVAPGLTGWADAFLIAIALAFGAVGQAQRIRPATGLIPVTVAFWQGGVPLIAFAFAARFGAISVAAGALTGVAAAAILTRVVPPGLIPAMAIRWVAVAALAIAAIAVAVGALRLT